VNWCITLNIKHKVLGGQINHLSCGLGSRLVSWTLIRELGNALFVVDLANHDDHRTEPFSVIIVFDHKVYLHSLFLVAVAKPVSQDSSCVDCLRATSPWRGAARVVLWLSSGRRSCHRHRRRRCHLIGLAQTRHHVMLIIKAHMLCPVTAGTWEHSADRLAHLKAGAG